jgi:hypothetical protein
MLVNAGDACSINASRPRRVRGARPSEIERRSRRDAKPALILPVDPLRIKTHQKQICQTEWVQLKLAIHL